MCCCNRCKRWTYQILKLKWIKTVRLTSSDICCAQSNYLHVSWTLWNEIMFWRQKRSIFSNLSGVLIFLATTVYMREVFGHWLSFCALAFIHHYNGFEIKQSRCNWSADFRDGWYIERDDHVHLVTKAGSMISGKSPSPAFKWSGI